jgi:hypothetical protein
MDWSAFPLERAVDASAGSAITIVSAGMFSRLCKWRPSLEKPLRRWLTIAYIVVVAVLFVSDTIADRRKRVTPTNVEGKVMAWAQRSGLTPRNVTNSEAPDCFFCLAVTGGKIEPIYVERRRNDPDHLTFSAIIHLGFHPKPTQVQLAQLCEELHAEMSRFKIDSDIPPTLDQIRLEQAVRIERDMTEDDFLRQFREVEFAWLVTKSTTLMRLYQITEESKAGRSGQIAPRR